jgi:branched-chain amino acid transport system substrate-binding protein
MRRRELLTAGAVGIAAYSPIHRAAQAQAGQKLVFAGALPLTGAAAETGLNIQNGYLTVASYINQKLGGVEIGGQRFMIEIRMSDDASDPARAVTIIQKQIDQGANFFLGSFGSNIVLPTAAIVERVGKLMVQAGGGSDQIFTQGFRNIFGMYPRSTRQFDSMARFLGELSPKPATASFVSTIDGYGRSQMAGAVSSCEKQGIRVLEKYQLPEKPTDFSSVLTSLRANTPDVLVTTLHDQDCLLLTRQMIATDTNVKLMFDNIGPELASFRESLGRYANGLAVSVAWDERVTYKDKFFGSAKTFADYYRSTQTRPLSHHTAAAAACVITYLLAMQEARSTTDMASIRKALAASDHETVYNRIKFTPEGDGDPIRMGFMVGQVQGGRIALVAPENIRTAPAVYPVPQWQQKT